MYNSDKVIKPIMFDNLDAIFDEKGSMFLALRRIQWCEEGQPADKEKSKLELRKWRITNDGTERADKGVAFLTEDGPHELVNVLIDQGFGHTKDVLLKLKHREDFKDSVDHLFDEESSTDGDFFDMRNALLVDDESTENDEE